MISQVQECVTGWANRAGRRDSRVNDRTALSRLEQHVSGKARSTPDSLSG